ncbi:MAG TPA: DUF6261 family protein [Bacteroidales bacterium]|nr:DUF6261 family protein [Bacteroidales bacterium]
MKSFSTSILTPEEVYTSGMRINSIINTHIKEDPFLVKIDILVKATLKRLSEALGRSIDPTAVKLLNGKDNTRDDRFFTFRDFCKAFVLDPDPALSSAANSIVALIREIGWRLYSEGYAAETAALDALFQRLATEPLASAVTTLNATSRLAALKAAQTDFETTFNTKVDTKAKETYPLIRKARIDVVRYQAAMLSYIDILAELDGGVFITASNKIDEVIVEFQTMAHARKTKKEKEENPPAK